MALLSNCTFKVDFLHKFLTATANKSFSSYGLSVFLKTMNILRLCCFMHYATLCLLFPDFLSFFGICSIWKTKFHSQSVNLQHCLYKVVWRKYNTNKTNTKTFPPLKNASISGFKCPDWNFQLWQSDSKR